MNFWDLYRSWEIAEKKWDEKALLLKQTHPLKSIKTLPKNSFTSKKIRFLKIKGLIHILKKDKKRRLFRYFIKKPINHLIRLFQSYLKKRSYIEDENLFFFGVNNLDQFKKILIKKEALLILGFSYCQRPYECPSKRFSADCLHDPENIVCRQCFIGKCMNAACRTKIIPLLIPDVNYIGEKIFEFQRRNPTKELLFVISSCSLVFNIFSDFAHMVQIKGLGVKIIGRECFTYKGFQLSEKGIKPGMTLIGEKEEKRILELIALCKNS